MKKEREKYDNTKYIKCQKAMTNCYVVAINNFTKAKDYGSKYYWYWKGAVDILEQVFEKMPKEV